MVSIFTRKNRHTVPQSSFYLRYILVFYLIYYTIKWVAEVLTYIFHNESIKVSIYKRLREKLGISKLSELLLIEIFYIDRRSRVGVGGHSRGVNLHLLMSQ